MSNIPLKTITFPGLDDTYTIPQVDDTLLTAGAAADAKKTGDEITDLKEALDAAETTLTHKADKDGTVASAEQLLSDVGTEDKVPYLFRAVPYDSTRVDEEVVGCSVGWNQLAPNIIKSLSHTWDADGSYYYTLSTNSGVALEVGHVYFAGAKITRTISGNNLLGLTINSTIDLTLANEAPNGYAYQIVKITSATTDRYIRFNNYSGKHGFNAGDSAEYDDLMVIDLTAWFGSTIADYAYTLEQATVGSGVAWIKALLPGGYIPYSAPKMESVSGLSAHVMRGFNQWDEEWELGGYNTSTGLPSADTDRIRSKNAVSVLPNTKYYFVGGAFVVIWYTADDTYITYSTPSSYNERTSPSNAAKLRFAMASTYGTTYKNDICINLSDPAKNGTYEPYKATTYALDSDLTLRGILKMDSDHRVYADGDIYKADGTVTRNSSEEIDLGTLNWSKGNALQSGDGYVYSINTSTLGRKGSGWTVVSGLEKKTGAVVWEELKVNEFAAPTGYFVVGLSATSVEDAKTYLTGKKVIFELATPTTETADPFTSPQNCTPGGTEEYVYAEGGSGIPVWHNSKYQKNMRSELERVSVAVPEVGSTAGTYVLKATVTAQGVTYGWVAE